jgi:hypothetical protein
MDSNTVNIITELGAALISGFFTLIGGILAGGFVLLAAWVTYKYGLQTYFKKREHEQIMKRYLEKGVDRASEAVAEVLRVLLNNELKATTILNELRKYGVVNQPVEFERFNREHLGPESYYKIWELIGDNIIRDYITSLLGFVEATTYYLDIDFRKAIASVPQDRINKENKLNIIKGLIEEKFKVESEFELLFFELQRIASILERETTLTWADLSKFKNRIEIQKSVERMKQKYAEIKKIQTQQTSKNNK